MIRFKQYQQVVIPLYIIGVISYTACCLMVYFANQTNEIGLLVALIILIIISALLLLLLLILKKFSTIIISDNGIAIKSIRVKEFYKWEEIQVDDLSQPLPAGSFMEIIFPIYYLSIKIKNIEKSKKLVMTKKAVKLIEKYTNQNLIKN